MSKLKVLFHSEELDENEVVELDLKDDWTYNDIEGEFDDWLQNHLMESGWDIVEAEKVESADGRPYYRVVKMDGRGSTWLPPRWVEELPEPIAKGTMVWAWFDSNPYRVVGFYVAHRFDPKGHLVAKTADGARSGIGVTYDHVRPVTPDDLKGGAE